MIFLASLNNTAVFAYSMAAEFLCEMGIKFYQQGKIPEALHEFNKALIINPSYEPALKYINMIEHQQALPAPIILPPVSKPLIEKPPILKPQIKTRYETIKEFLDKIEKEIFPSVSPLSIEAPVLKERKVIPPGILLLDENVKTLKFPLEIEKGKSIIIQGKNIQRFLATQTDILGIERIKPDEILVSGNNIGYTYLHIWDDNGRWTLELLGTPPKPEGLTLEEELRLAEEKASTFKLRYMLDWYMIEQGRRIDELERQTYSYTHLIDLKGPTPYGDFDSTVNIRTLKTTTDLTYLTLGLTKGVWGEFKDFTLRGFDYAPGFYNLAYSGVGLRGLMLESPVFNKKIDYRLFWGREGGGRYGNLSPGLAKIKDSFLGGLDLNYSPSKKADYGFSIVHGWGDARENYLNPYSYDLDINYHLAKLDLSYEVSHDSETFGHLMNATYNIPKLRLTAELRNVDKDFMSITGYGWRRGELGGLFTLNSMPTEKINILSRLDIFQDRLWPALDNDNRWNQDYDCRIIYAFNSLTSLNLNYNLQNELGRLSQFRSQAAGLGLSKTIDWIKRINTYLNYQHRQNKYFTSPSSDYINDRISAGLRFNLVGELYYYLNKEFNWLQERYSGTRTTPEVMETGLDWYRQIPNTQLFGKLRLTYRDEEDAFSNLSFLSGEDYLEGDAELTYRPKPETELYCSTRVRNIWADNPNVNKRLEADFSAGMRYFWDTGVTWQSIGTIEGYVFNDLNSDGLRQKDEAPVEGIKLWLGKDKSGITDTFGYYKFTKVKARKAYVNIDTTTIPSGFVLTLPAIQEAVIVHGQKTELNFGIISRTEISGVVFEDVDGDGQVSPKDLGVKDVVLLLEDGRRVTTDTFGRYFFRKVAVGEHTLILDLNSLPVYYLPKTTITKKIILFEGVNYIYNIPLKRIKE